MGPQSVHRVPTRLGILELDSDQTMHCGARFGALAQVSVGARSAPQVICICSSKAALPGVACPVPAADCNSDMVHLQVQQDLIWVWPESGPGAAEESLGKSPALGTLLSETRPGEGVV